MANAAHLDRIRDIVAWNRWRDESAERPDLSEALLSKADLSEANLSGANLFRVDLSEANLIRADLRGSNLPEADLRNANLRQADLRRANLPAANAYEANVSGADLRRARLSAADLRRADLREANLSNANLFRANLSWADLSRADLTSANLFRADLSGANLSAARLRGANLTRATLVETGLWNVDLSSARIYGVSVWNVRGTPATQTDLRITADDEATVTVDDLKVAQFLHLVLNNAEIRNVIDTVARKAVLILGRFTPDRKAVLDALRGALRERNYAPILFDFDQPTTRNLRETVSALAYLSRFIIADLTDPVSVPLELQAIVPVVKVPVCAILQKDHSLFSTFATLLDYPWVIPPYRYSDLDDLLAELDSHVIAPAEARVQR